MEYKFSIQIDDEKHTLSSINGISIKYLWELLRDLYKSVDIEEESKITLSAIRGNCYALDFTTEEQAHLERFKIVHKNIEELPSQHLTLEEKAYSKTLKKILGGQYYLRAYDNEKNIIATIKDLNKEKSITTYYTTKTIYGIVSEIGSKSLSSEKKHICIDGFPNNIKISKDIDLRLKQYYGSQKLMLKIKIKKSVEHNRILEAEMIDFNEVSKNSLSENLKEIGYVDIKLVEGVKTFDDIINRLYGNSD
jgi:hypothetical protein